MRKHGVVYSHLGTLLILIAVIACAICTYEIFGRRTAIFLPLDSSQLCTNRVMSCLVDNAHPGVVALGYNRKVFITALDLQKTGFVSVLMMNSTTNIVDMKCVAKEAWNVDLPGRLSPHESNWVSIGIKESSGVSRNSVDCPDIELYDRNRLLCELYIKDGKQSQSAYKHRDLK